jgi:hypothetical protein
MKRQSPNSFTISSIDQSRSVIQLSRCGRERLADELAIVREELLQLLILSLGNGDGNLVIHPNGNLAVYGAVYDLDVLNGNDVPGDLNEFLHGFSPVELTIPTPFHELHGGVEQAEHDGYADQPYCGLNEAQQEASPILGRGRVAHFFLPHRVLAALAAIWVRLRGLSLAALAVPPFSPPRRPRATAWGFFVGVYGLLLDLAGVVLWGFADGLQEDLVGELVGIAGTFF